MKKLLLFTLFLIVSCGVKEQPSAPPQPVKSGDAVEGVWVTQNKSYLLKASRQDFQVDPKFKVTYHVVTKDLEVSDTLEMSVRYWMPEMATMPVTPPVIEKLAPGKFAITYDISMEGPWEFIFTIAEKGKSADTFTLPYEVMPLE